MPTEEELEQLRKDNEKKRSQIADARAKQADNEAERQREVDGAQLLAEKARLEAELAAAKHAARVDTSRAGTENLIASAQAELEAAAARAENPPGVVDTNADNQPKNTTGETKAVTDGVVATAPDGTTTVTKPEVKQTGGNS